MHRATLPAALESLGLHGVDDLDAVIAGREVRIGPTGPSPGVRAAFLVNDGAHRAPAAVAGRGKRGERRGSRERAAPIIGAALLAASAAALLSASPGAATAESSPAWSQGAAPRAPGAEPRSRFRLSGPTARALSRTSAGLGAEAHPLGGHRVGLRGRIKSVLFATVDAAGRLRQGHAVPAEAASSGLGAEPELPGAARLESAARASARAARGTTLTVLHDDPPGEGFNDPTPVSPIPGNPASTRGEQALNAFVAAADWWAERLTTAVEIPLEASFEPLDCDESRAVLASLGNVALFRDFANAPDRLAPRPETWYPVALANAIAGVDLDPAAPDMVVSVNSELGSEGCLPGAVLSFATDDSAPPGSIGLFDLVRHSLGHGLGFMSYGDPATGQLFAGGDGVPRPDVFVHHLEDHSLGLGWPEMSDAERLASAVDTGDLHWVGPRVTAAAEALLLAGSGRARTAPGGRSLEAGVDASGHVLIYAPDPLERGASVTHWDTTLVPNELMEPFLTDNARDVVTSALLEDLGWPQPGDFDPGDPPDDPDDPGGPSGCVPDATTLCLGDEGRFETRLDVVDNQGPLEARAFRLEGIDDSGLFYYRDPNNLEMLLKVLDGCALTGHFWVLYAATTDVQFDLTVADTTNGETRHYHNAARNAAQAVIDTLALPCGESEASSPAGVGTVAAAGVEPPTRVPAGVRIDAAELPAAATLASAMELAPVARASQTPPLAIAELSGRPLSQDGVELFWTGTTEEEVELALEILIDGRYLELATLPARSRHAEVSGLSRHGDPGSTFTFRLHRRHAAGGSGASNEAPVRTFRDPPCSPSPAVLCLHDERFEVRIRWRDHVGNTGDGMVERIPGVDLSAVEWFLEPDNLEVLIKILDGCSLNDHWWVFSAAASDVELSTTVIDRVTGEERHYFNPLGRLAPAVTDTSAFAACP